MLLVRKSPLVAAATAVVILFAGQLASAAEPGIRVSYADLDMTTQKGVDTLYKRIHAAAERYCESLLIRTGSRVGNGYKSCVADAVSTTVQAMNLSTLSALHADRRKPGNRS